MGKKVTALLAMVFMALTCLQVPAFAGDLQTVAIDVANAANGYYEADGSEGTSSDYCYKIEDARILMSKTDVVYELSGSTDKSITIINSSKPTDAFNIRLNGVTLSGGINIQHGGYYTKVKVEAPAGTVNSVNKLIARDLTIFGPGSVTAQYVESSAGEDAALHITDAQLTVNVPTNSCVFNGACVIDGSAVVKYIATKDYAPLLVSNGSSLALGDSAKLYCLHNEPAEASGSYVGGLEMFSANLRLEGNSYLEAEARRCTNADYNGAAIASYGSVEVLGNAKIVARAYGAGLNVGNITVSGEGASIKAASEEGSGVACDDITVKDGGTVDASGAWQGIYSRGGVKVEGRSFVNVKGGGAALWADGGDLTVDGSLVQAESENDVALFSKAGIFINKSTVKADAASADETIRAWDDIIVDLSWLDLTSNGGTCVTGSITNSVVLDNNVGTVIGDAVTNVNNFINRNATLTIPEGASLTVGDGWNLRNDGAVIVEGTFSVGNGTLTCLNHSGGHATCVTGPLCELCGFEYAAADPAGHDALTHVPAVAATTTAEGNIEYWHCEDCGKYFANNDATVEITRAETVTSKLPEQQKPADTKPGATDGTGKKNDDKKANGKKKSGKTALPGTGDEPFAACAAMVLAGAVVLAGGLLVSKR